MLIKKYHVILLIFLGSAAFAATGFNQAFQEGQKAAKQNKNTASNSMKDVQGKYGISVNSNPPQTKYYGGETQSQTNMSRDSFIASQKSEAGSAVENSFRVRPMYQVDYSSPGMQQSQNIVKDASNISHGVSDEYVDCKKQGEKCTTTYTNATCDETSSNSNATCTKDLGFDTPESDVNRDVQIIASSSGETTFNVELITGAFTSADSKAQISVAPHLPTTKCTTVSSNYTIKPLSKWTKVTISEQPSCQNGYHLSFKLSGFLFAPKAQIIYHFVAREPSLQEHWTDNCTNAEQKAAQGICVLQSEVCTSGKATKDIDGIAVTRDCWQKTSTYNCGDVHADNNCKPLREQGCEQIGSSCLNKVENMCLVYQQTFRCPQKQCNEPNTIICNDSSFCINGDCTDHSYQQNDEFAQTVSGLSATAAAAQQFDTDSLLIYNGHPAHCRREMVGYSDCCADKGWGQDLGLAGCNDEEKQLGVSKGKGLTVYLGEYCADGYMGICFSHHKTYCVFDSKLSRIVEEQGRKQQLGIGFGSAEHPNCKGITPEQLEQIDFGKIDFSQFYGDLSKQTTIPDNSKAENQVSEHVRQFYDQGKAH